jgi:hypothetical protein
MRGEKEGRGNGKTHAGNVAKIHQADRCPVVVGMPERLPAGRAGGRKGESKALRTGNEKHDEDEGGDRIPGPSQRPSSVHGGGRTFPVMESGEGRRECFHYESGCMFGWNKGQVEGQVASR